MPSPLEQAIRHQLARYIDGQTTLQEFDRWFVFATQHVERSGSQTEIDLTYETELRLAEWDHGDWTKQELDAMLRQLAEVGLPAPVLG